MKKRLKIKGDKEFIRVSDLPRLNSAKLTHENHLGASPIRNIGEMRFICDEGWEVEGWATAPYKGLSNLAIVYRKNSPANPYDTYYFGREPGLYWGHCDPEYMMFPR